MSLSEQIDVRVRRISEQQHRLARVRADLESALRLLRAGAPESVMRATLKAKHIHLGSILAEARDGQ